MSVACFRSYRDSYLLFFFSFFFQRVQYRGKIFCAKFQPNFCCVALSFQLSSRRHDHPTTVRFIPSVEKVLRRSLRHKTGFRLDFALCFYESEIILKAGFCPLINMGSGLRMLLLYAATDSRHSFGQLIVVHLPPTPQPSSQPAATSNIQSKQV